MLKFFNDYEKVNQAKPPAPDPTPDPAPAGVKPETVPAMTADDIKSYFDAMKEQLLTEIKEQMTAVSAPSDSNINNGGEGDARNTDL